MSYYNPFDPQVLWEGGKVSYYDPLDPNVPDEGDVEDERPGRPPGWSPDNPYVYWDARRKRWDIDDVPARQWEAKFGNLATPAKPAGGGAGTAPARENAATAAAREERLARDAEAARVRQEGIDKYNRDRQISQDALAALDRQDKLDDRDYKRAIDARDYDEARRIQERREQRQAERDKINDKQQADDNKFREDQAKTAKDIARGYVDGMPTLTREQWEAEQANQPGNYYNYAFRSRGEEPPPRPDGIPPVTQGPASPLAPGTSTAATRDISNWRNMDIPTILATFSATELARLPLEALAQFPNEELLNIGNQYPGGAPAFLKLFPQERLATFGEDVQAQVRGTGDPNNANIPVTPPTPGQPLPIGGVGAPVVDPRTDVTRTQGLGQTQPLNPPGVVNVPPEAPRYTKIPGDSNYWENPPRPLPPPSGGYVDPGLHYPGLPPGAKLGPGGVLNEPSREAPPAQVRMPGVGQAPPPQGVSLPGITDPEGDPNAWIKFDPTTRQVLYAPPGTPGYEPNREVRAYGARTQSLGQTEPLGQPGVTVDPNMTLPALQKQGWTIDPKTGALMSPQAPAAPRTPSGGPQRRVGVGETTAPLTAPGTATRSGTGPGAIVRNPVGIPELRQGGRQANLPPAIRNPIMGKQIPTYRSQGNMPAFSAQARSRMSPSERAVLDVTINRTGGRAEDANWRDRLLTGGGAPAPRRRATGMPALTRR